MDSTAQDVMTAHGVTDSAHRARQITQQMLHDADLVLAMENRHIASITAMSPESRGKTFLIGKWRDNQEIPDPYRQHRDAFEHVYQLLEQSVAAWLPYLK